ncbi:MAG: DUF362 domain-containing protein [Methanomicrobiales archaeon]|nr:DUF362 domain-containing protein [Methanomicrobiales archaeon]
MAIKANFNSTDPFPAGTDSETLRAIFSALNESGMKSITLAERSGMGDTRSILQSHGIFMCAKEFGCSVKVIDSLGTEGFVHIQDPRYHWRRGFLITRDFVEADRVVSTCCLKTHRFGGHFTLSLKNSVGAIAQRDPADAYDYMRELHGSARQRTLIAEINAAYRTDLVIMDARKGFVRGGPESGDLIAPEIMLAGNDRVAIDAAGVAILRLYGTTPEVAQGPIAHLEQIARAAELGVGTADPNRIEIVPLDAAAGHVAERIEKELQG